MAGPDAESRFPHWVKPLGLCRPVGVVMLLLVALVLTNRVSAMTASVARPRLIALAYGRFRPQGAPHSYLALRFRIEEPEGQILETAFQEFNAQGQTDGIGGMGDSQCGIGGRSDGGIETTFIRLMRPLSAGTYRFRVEATGSLCDHNDSTSESSKVFVLRVDRKERSTQ